MWTGFWPLGCGTIEMETRRLFPGGRAELCGISIAAVFSISDSTTIRRESLSAAAAKRTGARRKELWSAVFPQALEGLLL